MELRSSTKDCGRRFTLSFPCSMHSSNPVPLSMTARRFLIMGMPRPASLRMRLTGISLFCCCDKPSEVFLIRYWILVCTRVWCCAPHFDRREPRLFSRSSSSSAFTSSSSSGCDIRYPPPPHLPCSASALTVTKGPLLTSLMPVMRRVKPCHQYQCAKSSSR